MRGTLGQLRHGAPDERVMELLGKANWWLPKPLARVLPTTSLGEQELPRRGPGPGVSFGVIPATAGPGSQRWPVPDRPHFVSGTPGAAPLLRRRGLRSGQRRDAE